MVSVQLICEYVGIHTSETNQRSDLCIGPIAQLIQYSTPSTSVLLLQYNICALHRLALFCMYPHAVVTVLSSHHPLLSTKLMQRVLSHVSMIMSNANHSQASYVWFGHQIDAH